MAIDPVTGVDDGVLPSTTQPLAAPPVATPPPAPAGGVLNPPMDTGAIVPPTPEAAPTQPLAPSPTTSPYITPQATVSGQLLDLLGKDSPYLKQATTGAREEAQRMGLLGSSMAIGAAERERIRAALPIAQQDAQLYGTSALDTQKTASESGLMTQSHTENLEALGVQADHQLRLEAYSQDAATKRSEMEMGFQANISNVEMDSQVRQQYLTSASDLGNQYNSDVGAILRSKDFESDGARNLALDQIEQVYQNNLNFLSSAAGVDLTWTASGGDDTGVTTGGGVIPAPPTTVPDVFKKVVGDPNLSDTAYFSNIAGTVPESGQGLGVDYGKFKTDFAKVDPFSSPSYTDFFESPGMEGFSSADIEKTYTDIMAAVLNPNNPTLVKLAYSRLHPEEFGSPYNGADLYTVVDDPTSLFQQYINDNL